MNFIEVEKIWINFNEEICTENVLIDIKSINSAQAGFLPNGKETTDIITNVIDYVRDQSEYRYEIIEINLTYLEFKQKLLDVGAKIG